MLRLQYSQLSEVSEIANCQIACFPESFNTALGKTFISKSLSWFLSNENRFLFHIIQDEKVVGFCGGFAPKFYGDGSSSGMLQFAFKEAIIGVLKKPWLFLNKELRLYYPFIWKNISKKIGLRKSLATSPKPKDYIFNPSVGLVVIGVHPDYRGKGIFEELMLEFENQAIRYGIKNCTLSVRANNKRAIAGYKKMGWIIYESKANSIFMKKTL